MRRPDAVLGNQIGFNARFAVNKDFADSFFDILFIFSFE
jgi:hypothetical protein